MYRVWEETLNKEKTFETEVIRIKIKWVLWKLYGMAWPEFSWNIIGPFGGFYENTLTRGIT